MPRSRQQVYPLMFGELMCRECGTWVQGAGAIEWPSPWELEMNRIPRVEWRYDDPDALDPDPHAGRFFDTESGIEVMPCEIAAVYNRLAEDLEAMRGRMAPGE